MPEDPVPVGVECDWYADMLHQALDQQEVAVGVLLLAEEGVDHRTGGIVHRDQQSERRRLAPQPPVKRNCHPSESACPPGASAAGASGAWAGAFAADC